MERSFEGMKEELEHKIATISAADYVQITSKVAAKLTMSCEKSDKDLDVVTILSMYAGIMMHEIF